MAGAKATPEAAQLEKLQKNKVSLDQIRKSIPPHCFVPSLERSLRWWAWDYGNVVAALLLHVQFAQTDLWRTSLCAQVFGSLFFWAWGGFFMWSMFVVGHDCGHGTFSQSSLVNHTFGLLSHGLLSVPYFPWRLSHFRHHQFHNHVTKDYSHPWSPGEPVEHKSRWLIPFVGWQMYLLGVYDGNHWLPVPIGRLYADLSMKEALRCLLSTAVVLGYWCAGALYCGGLKAWAFFYLPSVAHFSWWIWTVTYLQHHAEDTAVYDDTTWSYGYAAFETVDRTYGKGIELLHHHITDSHVVHHLFFNKIPHYHLAEATVALRAYCEKHHPGLYRHVPTPDFGIEVFRMFWRHTFDAILVSRKSE